jgi:hypothetical protein
MTDAQQIGWGTLAAAAVGAAVWGMISAWPFLRYMAAAAKVYLEDDDEHNDPPVA